MFVVIVCFMLDEEYMQQAIEQAKIAEQMGEVPVGAVVVCQGEIIATGYNQPISTSDPTAHAEVIALRQACKIQGNYRLAECELFVTLEPCAMCCGAMLHARIKRLVFAALDPKTGVVESCDHCLARSWALHRMDWLGGVMACESASLLRDFFKRRRM